jgi:predicted transcriptional regulator
MKLNTNVRTRKWNEKADKGRIYISIEDESVLENLENRRNRPIKLWRAYATAALAELGYTDIQLNWSQYAGCTCACSPGFVSSSASLRRKDIYVTVCA